MVPPQAAHRADEARSPDLGQRRRLRHRPPRGVALPAPGDEKERTAIAGHLAGIPLDRTRPLWEMYVIEGLSNGKVAVFSKMHHASVDGVSGASMLSVLCSLEPDGGSLAPVDPDDLGRSPSELELTGRGLLFLPPRAARRGKAGHTVRAAGRPPAPWPRPGGDGHGRAAHRASHVLQRHDHRSPLGGPRRHVARRHQGDQERHWHDRQRRGARGRRRRAAHLPVGARRAAERLAARAACQCRCGRTSSKSGGSNKVSALFTKLGADEADPVKRLKVMSGSNKQAKEHHKAIDAETVHLQEWAEFAAPRTFGLAVRVYSGLRLAREAPRGAQPGDLQRAGPAGAVVLDGRQDRRALPPRCRSCTVLVSTSP